MNRRSLMKSLMVCSNIFSALPYAFLRFLVWLATHTIYRIKVVHREHLPEQGGALLTPNHVSYLDAVLLVVSSPRPIRFMVEKEIYNIWWINPILRLTGAIAVSRFDRPKELVRALNKAREALKNGELVCLFPEGQLTRTGNMLRFHQGLERIMKGLTCPVIPVHLDRVWGSVFSFERGRYFFKWPKMVPYPVTISYGAPMPAASTAFAVRNRVMELGAEAFAFRLDRQRTLPEVFWYEARRHPWRFCLADSGGKTWTYGKVLVAGVALSRALSARLEDQQNVGVLLPSSSAGVLGNLAIAILGKVPVNINFTASQEAVASMVQQGGLRVILTSRAFLNKVAVKPKASYIFMEDLMTEMTVGRWLSAGVRAFCPMKGLSRGMVFGWRRHRGVEDLATIMFTSGSTGRPKGVMLTHANILSNIEGLYQVFHVRRTDRVLGALPLFHSFGWTATVWFPLISGMGGVYHPNPMDGRAIGRLIQRFRVTILMSTPTFLNAYLRRCSKEHMASLRLVAVGAETLRPKTAEAFREKFGLQPMEGYGCTELSPIVSFSLPDYQARGIRQVSHKAGTIGRPLPGVAVQIRHPETGRPVGPNESGLLFVKGPNVMKGYWQREDLTREVIQDGWYATGDMASLDEDGFLSITGRISRFSKIAGEMVPHLKIEEKMQEILNLSEQACVVTSKPDDKKGERLAVVCLPKIDVRGLVRALKRAGLPNLWIPAEEDFVKVPAIPLLGTGKVDLGKVQAIVKGGR